uniref:Putative cytoskeletal protein adducin n=1 Tax=Anopheles darlingi TaxID=43151 RepID=A0A2M4CSG6_ANODA
MATETETAAIHTNGGGLETVSEEETSSKPRPADIEADMREMERRKRVEAIMNSRLFREELERIVDGQMREGSSTILQQLSDIMGMPAARIGSVFKSSNCVVPINDIRGVESMSYEKGEKILRCKLAASFRLMDLLGWVQGIGCQITARLNADQELFLVNPYGMLFHEITASSLNKVNMQGQIVEPGTTNFGINTSQFTLHSVIHAARPDIRCAIYVASNAVTAVSALKQGLQPLTKHSALLGEIAFHTYAGALNEPEEKDKLLRSLGPVSKVLLLSNHGALCCGETIEEAFYHVNHMVQACEAQLKLLPVGLENLILIPEETRKAIYDAARKPSGDTQEPAPAQNADNKEVHRPQAPKWRVGGSEFEALMRMLDNAGFRTGYIFRNPLIKGDIPKPRNDIEVPPAVSSLGYLIEEEEFLKQGIWRKGDPRKVGDRTRWLNSPNVYQKVEVLETGTPDPKKITKWVAEPSPTHSSTPVKIEHAHQFVPTNTNPREFKRIQQQIKDNRRADKISAGPQSHILEGVSWDEANRMKDANVSAAGDHVVLMGAASKGIIQRGYQHNATVYKAPYAKNPFDSVTDDELNEYKKTVEKKRHGDGNDTDFSESEALSSLQISGPGAKGESIVSPPSQSEQEDAGAEHHVLRIETKQAPKPSQPEVVLSDGEQVQNGEQSDAHMSTFSHSSKELQDISTDGSPKKDKKKKKGLRTPSFLKKRKDKKRVES